MTIRKKLVIGVGSMLAMTIAIGVTSLNSIASLNTELETATQKTARRLQLSGLIDTAGANMLAGMRGIVMFAFAKDASRVESAKQLYDSAAGQWQKSLEEAQPLLVTEEGKRLVGQLQEELTGWQAVIVEIEQAAAQGDPDRAVGIAVAKGLPIYQANSRDAARFREIQNEILAAQQTKGASVFNSSRWTAIGVWILALAAGIAALLVVNTSCKTLQHAARELKQSSQQVASASGQIAASAQSLARGASEQAASVEETSASSEEISTMIRKNAEDSHRAADLMNETGAVVVAANQTLDEMEASMQQINAASEKIGKIIRVIDEIAFQTNILALNAAVEAARAGEAGMGFSVVADEVRNLAQRSAQAAKDTAGMIEESISRSAEGRVKLEQVSKAIRAITDKATQAKGLVDNVNVGSAEQARGIDQIAQAIVHVEKITQTSAATAEETASAGEELSAQAASMKHIVAGLEELVGAGDAQYQSSGHRNPAHLE